MAARTVKTLGTFLVSRSSNLSKLNGTASLPCPLRKVHGTLINHQSTAHYRAAVLSEIGKPLAIADIAPVAKLKDSEVIEV